MEKNKFPISAFGRLIMFQFLFGIVSISVIAEKVTIFYNTGIPQHEFAAHDIKKTLEARSFTVEIRDLSTLTGSYKGRKVVIALEENTGLTALLKAQGGNISNTLSTQAYAMRTTNLPQLSYWVLGGDDNGAMYGGLQVAENINFNGFTGSYSEDEAPHLKNRGIKFNIPLDKHAPTYYYDNHGTANRQAIADVWDMSFWTAWFDEMARHRYNVLSLWSPHPFTSMLNMEDEYSGIAINGVTGYDTDGNDLQVNKLTIDEKIKFWQRVMKYGKDRGFSTYFCTWNIFLSTAKGKHGLTDKPEQR